MRTPAGIECKYFYGDYFRGRNHEECRLLKESNQVWKASFCQTCPVPSVNRANACEHMRLSATITRSVLTLFKPRVKISAYCEQKQQKVLEAHIGCGECHPLPPTLK
jgi:hypothetical protein